MRPLKEIFCGLALLALGACSGAIIVIGDPQVPPDTVFSFTSFEELPESGTVVLDGVAVTGDYSVATPSQPESLTGIVANRPAKLRVTRQRGEIIALGVDIDGTALDFDTRTGASIRVTRDLITAVRNDGVTIRALATVNPDVAGFDYQSFGAWSDNTLGDADLQLGALSAGRRTDAADVPTGAATYEGTMLGFADFSGIVASTASIVELSTTDFTAMTFEARDTEAERIGGGPLPSGLANDVDMIGTLTIDGSTFSGTAAGGLGTASVRGRFYGPAAEEAGGTVSRPGSSRTFVGAFGASRVD